MTTFRIAGILSVVLPFAAIETANGAGIVSYDGWHSVRFSSADSLAGPGRVGRKNRGFRFATPNVAAAVKHLESTTAFGGTLSLSGGLIKTSSGTLQISPTTSSLVGISFFSGGTLNVGGAGKLTLTGSSTIDLTPDAGGSLLLSTLNYPPGGAIGIGNWNGVNVSGGTLTIEGSQTLQPLVIDSSAGTIVLTNGMAPPPPIDVSSQGSQPVPEPGAAALLALSAAALLARRRRR